jgi:hypothetical protein
MPLIVSKEKLIKFLRDILDKLKIIRSKLINEPFLYYYSNKNPSTTFFKIVSNSRLLCAKAKSEIEAYMMLFMAQLIIDEDGYIMEIVDNDDITNNLTEFLMDDVFKYIKSYGVYELTVMGEASMCNVITLEGIEKFINNHFHKLVIRGIDVEDNSQRGLYNKYSIMKMLANSKEIEKSSFKILLIMMEVIIILYEVFVRPMICQPR